MVVEKKRTKEKCYWESQPTGCLKPHCPFLHENPKVDPYDPETVSVAAITKAIVPQNLLPQEGNSGKIIVNRNKLDEIMQTPSNRMVVAPKKSVKDRLGQRVVREEVLEIDECSGMNFAQCGNSGNLLSHFFDKNFVKSIFSHFRITKIANLIM